MSSDDIKSYVRLVTEGHDLNRLKKEIEAGAAPKISAATYDSTGYSWGDLRSLGFASKDYRNIGRYAQEVWWNYSSKAPGPITLVMSGAKDRIMQPGDSTDPIEIELDRDDY